MDRLRFELTLPAYRSRNPDGGGLCRRDHLVQHRDGDGDLALLSRQTPGAKLGADQVFVARHCRFRLVPPAIPSRSLPADATTLGHELDVTVAQALGHRQLVELRSR